MVTKIHKPSKFSRFVLYPLAFLAFVLIFIGVLTYANGYKLDKKDGKWVLQKTGILIVATRPGEARIILNGKNTKKVTTFPFLPVKITSLFPTTYKLELIRDGYRKWENTVKVESNYVTWANYILLFPDDLKIAKVDPLDGKTVLAQSKNERFLLVSGKEQDITAFYTFDTTNNNLEKVWPKKNPPAEPYLATPVIKEAQLSENNDKLIAKVQKDAGVDFVTIDLNGTDGKITSLNTNYKTSFDRVEPDPVDSSFVFATQGKNLYHLNLNNSNITSPITSALVDFYPEKNRVVYFVENGKTGNELMQAAFDGSRKETIKAIVASDSYKFSYSSQENVLMVLPKQEKTLTAYFRVNNQMTTIDLAKSVNDFNWSINGRYLYYYSGKNIKHYDWDRQRETAVNLESDIQKLNWFFDENHYLVSTEKGVFEIDLDNTNRIEFTTKNSTFYQDPRLTSLIFKEDNVFKKFSGNF